MSKNQKLSRLELTTYGLQVFGLMVFLSLTQIPALEGLTPFDFDQLVGSYLVYFGILGVFSYFLDAPMFISFGGGISPATNLTQLRKGACLISVILVLVGVGWIIM